MPEAEAIHAWLSQVLKPYTEPSCGYVLTEKAQAYLECPDV